VLEFPEEAQAIGQRSRERMVMEYDLRQIIAEHDRLYTEAMGR